MTTRPAYICDIDGVVLRDGTALPGAVELVEWLEESGHPFLFLTNYPSQTPRELSDRFARTGLRIAPERFYTSAMAMAEFLKDQAGDRRKAFLIGEGALVYALYQAGFTLTDADPDFVVLGETDSFNFDMIRRAAQLVRNGARFLATNPDVVGPQGRPSCGALSAPIERISGRRPFYVGKPNAFMMRAALRALSVHSEETWIIGDNMDTDVIAGIQSGMQTVLVLSGVSQREDLVRYPYRPHHIVEDARALLRLLRGPGPASAGNQEPAGSVQGET